MGSFYGQQKARAAWPGLRALRTIVLTTEHAINVRRTVAFVHHGAGFGQSQMVRAECAGHSVVLVMFLMDRNKHVTGRVLQWAVQRCA